MLKETARTAVSCLVRNTISPFRRTWYFLQLKRRLHGIVRFNGSVSIGEGSSFEGANSLGDRTRFTGSLGYGTYLCEDCVITGTVGRFTSIAAEVRSAQGIHPTTAPFATTSPLFYSVRKQAMVTFASEQCFEEIRPALSVGNDCWIGVRAFFSGGVTVSDGAIILPGAVVTKDVPPYAIVGGVPAKVLRYRYDEKTISWLLKVRWWDKPVPWLQEHWRALGNLEELKRLLT